MNQEIELKIEQYISSALKAEFIADLAHFKKCVQQPPAYVPLLREVNEEVRGLKIGIDRLRSIIRRLKKELLKNETELKSVINTQAPIGDKVEKISRVKILQNVVWTALVAASFGFLAWAFWGFVK